MILQQLCAILHPYKALAGNSLHQTQPEQKRHFCNLSWYVQCTLLPTILGVYMFAKLELDMIKSLVFFCTFLARSMQKHSDRTKNLYIKHNITKRSLVQAFLGRTFLGMYIFAKLALDMLKSLASFLPCLVCCTFLARSMYICKSTLMTQKAMHK